MCDAQRDFRQLPPQRREQVQALCEQCFDGMACETSAVRPLPFEYHEGRNVGDRTLIFGGEKECVEAG